MPALAAVRVGTVAKVYPRAGVAVVQLTRLIRVGDVLDLRRVEHTFVGGRSAHHWSSGPCVVASIRDSANQQLDEAEPAPPPTTAVRGHSNDDDDNRNDDRGHDDDTDASETDDGVGSGMVRFTDDVASQFAVKLQEVGKRGDSVYWCGHGAGADDDAAQ